MFNRVLLARSRIGLAAVCCLFVIALLWTVQAPSARTWSSLKHINGIEQHQGPPPKHLIQSRPGTFGNGAHEEHPSQHQESKSTVGRPNRPDEPSQGVTSLKPLDDFPNKVWHINIGSQVDGQARDRTNSWQEKNPSFRQEFITGTNAETFVREHFSDRPDLINPFLEIRSPILRADILRHLVLLAKGGVYADLDVECRRPVTDWIPEQYKNKANIVVGLEMDFPDQNYVSMATWTIYARPGNRKFEQVLLSIYDRLNKLAELHNTTLARIGTDVARIVKHDVIVTTGPEAFTRAMFEGIGVETNTDCDMRNATDLKEPLLLSDVLILPINSFGDGQLHSHSGEPDRGVVFVHHYFKGSWLAAVDKRGLDAKEMPGERLG